jgi:molybdopterin-guanine dinucleotide biosynthesis protein
MATTSSFGLTSSPRRDMARHQEAGQKSVKKSGHQTTRSAKSNLASLQKSLTAFLKRGFSVAKISKLALTKSRSKTYFLEHPQPASWSCQRPSLRGSAH